MVGEVIRRITGRFPGVFFAEEVAGPLGADFHIGLPAEHDHRVAPVIAPPSSPSGRCRAVRAGLRRDRPRGAAAVTGRLRPGPAAAHEGLS